MGGTLQLAVRDWAALDTVWVSPLPFVLWPVGNQPLLAHWMDEARRTGASRVEVFVADRPDEVRRYLEGGAYWSLAATVITIARESDAPAGAVWTDRLPGARLAAPPSTGTELLAHWFSLQRDWFERRAAANVTIDIQAEPGGWIGPRARIAKSARLRPPYWIGPRTTIGPGCAVGPYALIGADCILDQDVEVLESFLLDRTFAGRNTRFNRALAQGGTLVDWGRGCRVDIAERFILGPVDSGHSATPWGQRLAALVVWAALAPAALLLAGGRWNTQQAADGAPIRTGLSGPLCLRRWPWLEQIWRGRWRWFGCLPRTEADLAALPFEPAGRLRESPPGLFSLSDVHGCHHPGDPEETVHALYQALQADPNLSRIIARRCWTIALTDPDKPCRT